MISLEKMEKMLSIMAESIDKNERWFCELDAVAGDGDFGMSLAKGFRELQKNWEDLDRSSISSFLRASGLIISEFCGGASGPIWGSAFRAAAKASLGKTSLHMADFADMMQAAVEGIQARGGAKLGDKTLLDALIPCVEALRDYASACGEEACELQAFLWAGAKAAQEGAEKTKGYAANQGRASYVGERSLGAPDAGAMALGVIFGEIAQRINEWR